MNLSDIQKLAEGYYNPRLDEQRLAFPTAVQSLLGDATSRGMAYSPATYVAVENLAQQETEQRGRIMLDGYKQALAATPGIIPHDVTTEVKRVLNLALTSEAQQAHSHIQYVREAIKPTTVKSAAELLARPLQKLLADFDLSWAKLNTERGQPTFGWKPSSIEMRTLAALEQGQLSTREAVQDVIQQLFLHPETDVHYYYQVGTELDEALNNAIDSRDILLTKSEFRFFKHPEVSRHYVKIEEGAYHHDWQKQAAEFTPEFVRATLELSGRKRAELETINKVQLEDQIREQLNRQKWAHEVFLSYSDRDNDTAAMIHRKVISAGGRIFMAPKEISAGDDFADAIRNALFNSRELWLLVSPQSAKSEWVITEWGAAWVLKKKIVPILYRCDHTALPQRLRGIQSVDLHLVDELIAKTFGASGKSKV